jgi:hypothetical protein
MHLPKPHILVPSQRLIQILVVTALLNVFFLVATALEHNEKYLGLGRLPAPVTKELHFILQQGNLATENVVAVWYSSMLLLTASVISMLCFVADQQKFSRFWERLLSYGWIGFGLVLAVLSLDEVGSFHETIGDSALLGSFGSEVGWTAFYIIVDLVGLYIVLFGLMRVRRSPIAFVAAIAGVLLFLSNPLQEAFEINAFRSASDPASWRRPTSLLLLEEGTEMFGSWCFILATLVYASGGGKRKGAERAPLLGLKIYFPYSYKQVLNSTLLTLCVLALLLLATLYFGGPIVEDSGIPKNWFPSAVAFLVFLYCLYRCSLKTTGKKRFLVLSCTSLLVSVVYGSNLYWMRSLRGIITLAALTLSILLWKLTKSRVEKLTLSLWAICLCAAFIGSTIYSLPFSFIAYSLLPIMLILNFRQSGWDSPTSGKIVTVPPQELSNNF